VVVAFVMLLALAVVATVMGRLSNRADAEVAIETDPAGRSESEAAQPNATQLVDDPVAVAADVVALTGEVVDAGPISRRELIESFTTADFGPILADTTAAQLSDLQVEFGVAGLSPADLRAIEVPVTARLVERVDNRARVEVWSVMAVSVERSGGARQVWRTVGVDLDLVEGEWLVDGWHSTLGPTPALAPEAPVSPAGDVADVLAWDAARGGRG
jgi:Na+-transporting methylmalonyl-CoA/oxaloacetate decarboxylase gamma subunit